MNIVLFGAGSTGRGHLAALLYEEGFRNITFIERDAALADALARARRYDVLYVGGGGSGGCEGGDGSGGGNGGGGGGGDGSGGGNSGVSGGGSSSGGGGGCIGGYDRKLTVAGFSAVRLDDSEGVSRAILSADLVLTAVIAENLQQVASALAPALSSRCKAGVANPVNIICCENLNRASGLLKKQTAALLGAEALPWFEGSVGFPDCMISRVVPVYKDDPLTLVAEDYNEWVVDKKAVKGPVPPVSCIDFADDLDAKLEKKLWVHNGGHAAVAYAGFLYGHEYVHEALKDGRVVSLGASAMDEIGNAVSHKHGYDRADVKRYEMNLVARGQIEEMRDRIARVVRNPIRKLGLDDRLLGPALYCHAHGMPYGNIARSVLNVTKYFDPSDDESVRMKADIGRLGLRGFLSDTLGLAPYPEVVDTIINSQ